MYGMCCCEPPTCTLVSDDSTLANFTQETGTWTKPGSYIETTSANGIILHNTAHPDGYSTGAVGFDWIVLPAAGGKARILFAYYDSDNYLFQEYEVPVPGTTTGVDVKFRLGYRQGGADTILEEYGTFETGGAMTTEANLSNNALCYNGELLSSTGTGVFFGGVGGMDSPLSSTGLTLGTQVGLQVIGNAGTVKFQNINFYGDNSVSCTLCRGACYLCSMGISGTPSEYSVYLSGVTNGTFCSDCVTAYDGMTFILETGGGDARDYATRSCGYYSGDGACGPPAPSMFINIGGVTADVTLIRLEINTDGRWDFGRTANACNETLIDSAGSNIGSGFQRCDWSACSATITPNMA